VKTIRTDICVIGAGSGGLSVAAGAAQLGRSVVLIEKGEMGGDCLNAGCVPSKALIAAARAAQAQRSGADFGVTPVEPSIDGARVHAHIREVIASIAPNDSQARFEGLGVKVIRNEARFADRRSVIAGEQKVVARNFVIATGSRPAVPPIPGLSETPYFTNETIFNKDFIPSHLIVIGGGSIGIELAQAHRRLGSQVTLVESAKMLARTERPLAQIVLDQLTREGIVLREGAKVANVGKSSTGVRVEIARVQGQESIEGSHLLIATGRLPNVEELDLKAAGVASNARGIIVDAALKTSNRRIYAIGDVAGGPQFTHVAGYHAGLVVRNLLFRLPVHTSYDATPEVLYSEPEIAQVGITQAEAEKRKLSFEVFGTTLTETDRGRTDRVGETLVKVIVGRGARVLGASIVGPNAGELILPWVIAVSERMALSKIAGLVVPYPTLGDHMKRISSAYYSPTLFSRRSRALVSLLSAFR
jgi:pyruvate/2-oxoglutarate dehydrogenase complex dihydrolipoamide dehydrogenase (E3) component